MFYIVEVIVCLYIKCLGSNMFNIFSVNLFIDRLKYLLKGSYKLEILYV